MAFLFTITLLPLTYVFRTRVMYRFCFGYMSHANYNQQKMKPQPHDISYWFWGEVAIVLLTIILDL